MSYRTLNIKTALALLATLLATVTLTTSCGEDDNDTFTPTRLPFQFRTAAAGAFARVDRVGMPAINTVVISAGNKDTYNGGSPANDALGTFVGDITANVDGLHMALDDDLMGLGLTPCATADCVAQAAPLVVPDTLTIDPTQPSGFPNGRRLPDQVIDVTLAVILLDLGVHGAATLAGVPVNPPANDKVFFVDFPYLATPH